MHGLILLIVVMNYCFQICLPNALLVICHFALGRWIILLVHFESNLAFILETLLHQFPPKIMFFRLCKKNENYKNRVLATMFIFMITEWGWSFLDNKAVFWMDQIKQMSHKVCTQTHCLASNPGSFYSLDTKNFFLS